MVYRLCGHQQLFTSSAIGHTLVTIHACPAFPTPPAQITCTHTQITCTPTHPHTPTHTHTNADSSVAVVWVDGQQAVITFTSNRDDTRTAYVSANTSYTYTIHRNPVDYTLNPTIRCTLDYIGDNITQPLNLRQDATDHTVNIELTEMYFQSVAVYNVDGSVLACGTIFIYLRGSQQTCSEGCVHQCGGWHCVLG